MRDQLRPQTEHCLWASVSQSTPDIWPPALSGEPQLGQPRASSAGRKDRKTPVLLCGPRREGQAVFYGQDSRLSQSDPPSLFPSSEAPAGRWIHSLSRPHSYCKQNCDLQFLKPQTGSGTSLILGKVATTGNWSQPRCSEGVHCKPVGRPETTP